MSVSTARSPARTPKSTVARAAAQFDRANFTGVFHGGRGLPARCTFQLNQGEYLVTPLGWRAWLRCGAAPRV
jgi:hypothetical protein